MSNEVLHKVERLNAEAEAAYAQDESEEALRLTKQAMDLGTSSGIDHSAAFVTTLYNFGVLTREQGDDTGAKLAFEQALAILRRPLGTEHGASAHVFRQLTEILTSLGQYDEAESLYKEAIGISRNAGAEEHLASQLDGLATLYLSMNRYSDAEPLFREATEILRVRAGEASPAYATSLGNLAAMHFEAGRYAEAESLCRQVSEIRYATTGENDDYSTSLNNLAAVYLATDRFSDAEPLLERAREVDRQLFGQGHPRYATSLHNLAVAYAETGRSAEAEQLLQEAAEVQRRVLGEKHEDYARSIVTLARLYHRIGFLVKSEQLFSKGLDAWRNIGGERHAPYIETVHHSEALQKDLQSAESEIARSGRVVADLYAQGRYAEALPVATRVSLYAGEVFGESHPLYATTLTRLYRLHNTMGNYAEAVPLCQRALAIRRDAFGERHSDYAASLTDLAALYENVGRVTEAETHLREALEIRRVIVGENHPDYATSLHNLASLYVTAGRYPEAESLYRRTVSLFRVAFGEQDKRVAICLSNLANLFELMGRYAEAEPLVREAIEVKRVALGVNHPDYAISLKVLALLYESMGRYAEAEPLFREALQIQNQTFGAAHPDRASTLSGLATVLVSIGRYEEAESLHQQALEVLRASVGESHPDYVLALHDLTALYHALGRYRDVERLAGELLDRARLAFGEGHPHYAIMLSNIAVQYESTGRYHEAEPLHLKAMEILQKTIGEQHPTYATRLSNLAGLYRKMERHVESAQCDARALEIRRSVLGKDHPEYASSLMHLGQLHELLGQYADAEAAFVEGIRIFHTSRGENHREYTGGLVDLAQLYKVTGRYAEAESLYHRATELLRPSSGPAYAKALNGLALVYADIGKYSEAEHLYCESTEIVQLTLGEDHPDYQASLSNKALVLAALNKIDDAARLMTSANVLSSRIVGQAFAVASETERIDHLWRVRLQVDGFLSLVQQYLPDSPSAINDALDLVLRRKAISIESLTVQRDAVLGGRYPNLKETFHELSGLRMQIARTRIAGARVRAGESHRQLINELENKRASLERDLARQVPEVNLQERLRLADRQAVATALPEGSTLLEFVRFREYDFRAVPARGELRWKPSRYIAFIIPSRRAESIEMVDLGPADSLDALVTTFRQTMADGCGRGESAPTSHVDNESQIETDLRHRLLDPILARCPHLHSLDDGISCESHLVVAPDGELTQLPFEMLLLNDGRRVIDAYRVSYLATGRDVLRWTFRGSLDAGPAIVAGDPRFEWLSSNSETGDHVSAFRSRQSKDLDRSMCLRRLPGTHAEAVEIARMLGVEPWLEDGVLESRLKRQASPRILHLATHGAFLENQTSADDEPTSFDSREITPRLENPMLRSMLCLAGAQTFLDGGTLPPEAEDGLLTAEDVAGMDLIDTELVVLSACDTGRGEVKVGEGVFGLRRAFAIAGAKTLVMSLWKVPDEATRMLMVRFYEELKAGRSRIDALRTAQLHVRERYPDPYYWGAFILQGEAIRPLPFGPRESQ